MVPSWMVEARMSSVEPRHRYRLATLVDVDIRTAAVEGRDVGPGTYFSPRHSTHFECLCLELGGIL